jgi:hypothetical protein
MTAAEFIKELEQCRPDAKVILVDLSGENIRCEEVCEVDGIVFKCYRYTAYMDYILTTVKRD